MGGTGFIGPIEELHPKHLQEILKRVSQEGAADVQLIDVREDFEHQIASLPGFKLMPMSRFLPRPREFETLLAASHNSFPARAADLVTIMLPEGPSPIRASNGDTAQ